MVTAHVSKAAYLYVFLNHNMKLSFTTDTCDAGKLCIEVAPTSKVSWISEELCIGCGICVKVTLSLLFYDALC